MSLDWLLKPQLIAFGEAGYEVIGVSAPGPHVKALDDAGISHVALHHATRSFDLREDLRAVAELYRLFRRLRPDIVHTHNPKPGVYGRIAARLAGVPLVVNTQHGLYATPEDRLSRRLVVYSLERIAAQFSDVELLQSVEDYETLRRLRVPAAHMIVIGNGIDLQRFSSKRVAGTREEVRRELGVGDADVVVGLVGRLVIEKGYREVFQAAKRLRSELPAARFVVVGPGDEAKADAISAAEQADAERDGVLFLGHRDDVDRLLAGMDVYVLASHREGFPRSAMEACATGLPVVATNIRGCRQVVEDGVTGLLVPPGDPDALARAVADLVSDPQRRREMGTAAAAKAGEEFDQDDIVRTCLAVYGGRTCRRSGEEHSRAAPRRV
ncbi:MAG: glycosyltransferase family 4 protein [Actinobacteria bacterium]|nr:glycosyltransferase family 4 protein [Actinomycetota bacterium]